MTHPDEPHGEEASARRAAPYGAKAKRPARPRPAT